MKDIIFQVLLLIMIHFRLLAKVVDIITAFMHGDLEEEIYMKCPPGMKDIEKDDCINIDKCFFGLVQARQYNKKAVEILKKVGFTGGNAHPCLNMKKSMKGIEHVALYVDDNLMKGSPETINEAVEQL